MLKLFYLTLGDRGQLFVHSHRCTVLCTGGRRRHHDRLLHLQHLDLAVHDRYIEIIA